VRDGGVSEHPHDVQERVGIAKGGDVEERGRARPGPRGAPHVRELDRRGGVLFRFEQIGQPVEPFVRDARNADVRFLTAAGPGRLAGARQELKERGLA
jgi:hypothetical protein